MGVEALFTSALGLNSPWEVVKVDLDTAKRRIDFEVAWPMAPQRGSALDLCDWRNEQLT
jgi:hypothetical protein